MCTGAGKWLHTLPPRPTLGRPHTQPRKISNTQTHHQPHPLCTEKQNAYANGGNREGCLLVEHEQSFSSPVDVEPAHQILSVLHRGAHVTKSYTVPMIERRGQKPRWRLWARGEEDGGDLVVSPPLEESIRISVPNLQKEKGKTIHTRQDKNTTTTTIRSISQCFILCLFTAKWY